MNLLSDWKWYSALAVFVLFTAFVVWLPGPGTRPTAAPATPSDNATPSSTVAPAPEAPQDASPAPSPAEQAPAPLDYDDMLQYTVQNGDTVEGIARLFVVSEDDLRRVNRLRFGEEFAPGDRILIPPSEL